MRSKLCLSLGLLAVFGHVPPHPIIQVDCSPCVFPLSSPEWPCQFLPMVTEEAWGVGTTQPCHLGPDQRDPALAWQEPWPWKATVSMELESKAWSTSWVARGRVAAYPEWGSFKANGSSNLAEEMLKIFEQGSETCKNPMSEIKGKWEKKHARNAETKAKGRRGGGNVEPNTSLEDLHPVGTSLDIFLGHRYAFLWPQSICWHSQPLHWTINTGWE